MEIADLVAPGHVVPCLRAASKKHALQDLARRAAEPTGIDRRIVFDALLERERLGTTGMGQGIAIPHARLPGLAAIFGLFARAAAPIDFEAVDGQPVDLVFLLLAPEGAGADHLKALARISRLLRNREACERLRTAADAEAIYALLTAAETGQSDSRKAWQSP